MDHDVIEILDSGEDEAKPGLHGGDRFNNPKQAISHDPNPSVPGPSVKIEHKTLGPNCRENADTNSPTHDSELARDGDGRFIVTRKFKVDAVEHLDSVPSHWPVPKVDTAYILDFMLTTTAPAYNYNHTSIVSPYTIPTYSTPT